MNYVKYILFILKIVALFSFIFITYCYYLRLKEIENLNKQIELLECYKENYLIMADSLDGIHVKCFRIGEN